MLDAYGLVDMPLLSRTKGSWANTVRVRQRGLWRFTALVFFDFIGWAGRRGYVHIRSMQFIKARAWTLALELGARAPNPLTALCISLSPGTACAGERDASARDGRLTAAGVAVVVELSAMLWSLPLE